MYEPEPAHPPSLPLVHAHPQFGERVAARLAEVTGHPFVSATNKFAALSGHEPMVQVSAALRTLAGVLLKIANDVRWYASGPRAGIGELEIAANEPGSSIMLGKVNPTQCEALANVASAMNVCPGLDQTLLSFCRTRHPASPSKTTVNSRPGMRNTMIQSRLCTSTTSLGSSPFGSAAAPPQFDWRQANQARDPAPNRIRPPRGIEVEGEAGSPDPLAREH
jgi:hypothetical protein